MRILSNRAGSAWKVPGIMLFSLLIASCGDVSGPSDTGNWFGWAVGGPVDGYAFIVATGNGGVNWNRQGDGSLPEVQLECVRAIDSLTAWVVGDLADGYATILRTDDGGSTWIRQGSASTIPDKGLNGISPLDGDNAYVVGMDNTILYTSDGGGTWVSMADPAYDGFDYDGVYALDHSNIWIVGGDVYNGIILHSTDGGNSWESQGDSLLLEGYALIRVSAIDASNAWLVGHGYTIAYTTNGGVDWEVTTPADLDRNPQAQDANGVCIFGSGRVLVTMDSGGIYLTTDAGSSWTKQTSPVADYLLGVCAIDANTAWIAGDPVASGNGHILRTRNGGATWAIQDMPENVGVSDVSFVNSHH